MVEIGYKQAPSVFELMHIDKAVEDKLVYFDSFGCSCCKDHGAMNAVNFDSSVYRCLAWGCPLGIKLKELEK